ncbi:MAG: hypothetical protein M3Y72_20395 [Acidobacteriota bacterium]|nr:hypothetical protein [Acidobacteriota bacterium]
MDRQEELKSKYRPALEAMQQQGVQVSQVALRDNKLYVEGTAPSQEAKNAVWNQIKAIDSSYSDLTCDIKVGSAEGAGADIHSASPQDLAGGLAAAFRSDQTPAFPSMLSNLFSNSDGQQRAGLLNHLLGSVGPGLLGGALTGPLASILKGGTTVTPEQAQQIPPESVQSLAEHAQKSNPSIIDQVSGFYSQHPKVIQALGAGALAMIMSHRGRN